MVYKWCIRLNMAQLLQALISPKAPVYIPHFSISLLLLHFKPETDVDKTHTRTLVSADRKSGIKEWRFRADND